MAKQKTDEVKDQIKEQNDEVYGDETVSGSSPDLASDDSTKQSFEDTFGNKPKTGVPTTIAEEIEKDEENLDEDPFPEEAEDEEADEE